MKNYKNFLKLVMNNKSMKFDDSMDDDRLLIDSVLSDNIRIVEELLRLGCDVNTIDQVKRSLLHHAVHNNLEEMVKLLIEHGADVNCQDYQGYTPLHEVFINPTSNYIIAQLLIAGSDVNIANNSGDIPLHLATNYKAPDIINSLIEYKSDVNKKDNDGNTPLNKAVNTGYLENVLELLKANADTNIPNNQGKTPIFNAKNENKILILKELIKHNANINWIDKLKKSPLYYFSVANNINGIRILMDNKVRTFEKDIFTDAGSETKKFFASYSFQKWLAINSPDHLHYLGDLICLKIKNEYPHLIEGDELGLL